ncbi:MAG: PEGA domain-containing protein [Calditrichaceae bacterium]
MKSFRICTAILIVLGNFVIAQDSLSILQITSSPSGSKIYLDGEISGSTPNVINRITTGKHRLKLSRDGYEDWITTVHVELIDTNKVHAILNPLRGQIQVNCDIENADIYIDGRFAGKSPKLFREIEYGLHYIEVKKTDGDNEKFNSYKDTVYINDPNILIISARLKNKMDTGILNQLNIYPLAVYLFNGNARDESGKGNDGIVHGATLTEDRFGNPNSAYEFDGIDDYIDIGSSSILKPDFPISLSLWVKPKSFNYPSGLFRNDNHESRYYGIHCTINTNGKVAIGCGNGGLIGSGSRENKQSYKVLEQNIWYHIVGIYKDIDDLELYINGEYVEGEYNGTTTSLVNSQNSCEIGTIDHRRNNPPYYANAVIDNIYLFDRELSEQEILNLYNDNQ